MIRALLLFSPLCLDFLVTMFRALFPVTLSLYPLPSFSLYVPCVVDLSSVPAASPAAHARRYRGAHAEPSRRKRSGGSAKHAFADLQPFLARPSALPGQA